LLLVSESRRVTKVGGSIRRMGRSENRRADNRRAKKKKMKEQNREEWRRMRRRVEEKM
jgi:hypothetical protein